MIILKKCTQGKIIVEVETRFRAGHQKKGKEGKREKGKRKKGKIKGKKEKIDKKSKKGKRG